MSTPTPADGPYADTAEICRRYRIGRSTVYDLLGAGLPSLKIGRSRRFDVRQTDAWMAEHCQVAA